MICPFCKRDPYHYEDVGVGYVPVAVNCCETMCGLENGEKKAKQILRLRRKGTPKSVRRANKIWDEVYGEGPFNLKSHSPFLCSENIEIIGNIYENPELLPE